MEERSELEMSSVETQLLALYTERELLERELGTADPDELVQLVRKLEEQLQRLDDVLAEPASSPAQVVDWSPVLERVGGDCPADVLAYLDERDVRLVALEASCQDPTTSAVPATPPPTTAIDSAVDRAASSSLPFGEVVAGLRSMAAELCEEFERSELAFEGEIQGARWSLRCSSGGS
ncbi:MAG: hypothetical protein GC161_05550 [Planctomycetaceae bacterium]|nr:hypothetical protein [Planctomycetaceae bacterium]